MKLCRPVRRHATCKKKNRGPAICKPLPQKYFVRVGKTVFLGAESTACLYFLQLKIEHLRTQLYKYISRTGHVITRLLNTFSEVAHTFVYPDIWIFRGGPCLRLPQKSKSFARTVHPWSTPWNSFLGKDRLLQSLSKNTPFIHPFSLGRGWAWD
jgi:hypothetical protein